MSRQTKVKTSTTSSTTLEPITLDESKRLIELEKTVEAGRQTFIAVGTALAEIRDTRLYKADFATFDEYCDKRWGFTRAHAHRLIEAASLAKEMSPVGDIPNERTARELARVPAVERAIVVKAATAKANSAGRKMTSKDISQAALPRPATVSAVLVEPSSEAESPQPDSSEPTSPSTESMLRRLWGVATPVERSSFLEWVKTQPVEDDDGQFKCNSCEATFADASEGVSLYECNDCGTRFTQDTSANGNHQCPDCNKFGSKVSDCGCPECGEGELEQCLAVANN